ncbi:MAG: hypothetical protein JJT90_06345 [Ectothiorhodospiraceae bacterium]|nr:hypothetical protein [Ectothiorhodospiraceae bacterium]
MTNYCKGMLAIALILGAMVVLGFMSLNGLHDQVQSSAPAYAEITQLPEYQRLGAEAEALWMNLFTGH